MLTSMHNYVNYVIQYTTLGILNSCMFCSHSFDAQVLLFISLISFWDILLYQSKFTILLLFINLSFFFTSISEQENHKYYYNV